MLLLLSPFLSPSESANRLVCLRVSVWHFRWDHHCMTVGVSLIFLTSLLPWQNSICVCCVSFLTSKLPSPGEVVCPSNHIYLSNSLWVSLLTFIQYRGRNFHSLKVNNLQTETRYGRVLWVNDCCVSSILRNNTKLMKNLRELRGKQLSFYIGHQQGAIHFSFESKINNVTRILACWKSTVVNVQDTRRQWVQWSEKPLERNHRLKRLSPS